MPPGAAATLAVRHGDKGPLQAVVALIHSKNVKFVTAHGDTAVYQALRRCNQDKHATAAPICHDQSSDRCAEEQRRSAWNAMTR